MTGGKRRVQKDTVQRVTIRAEHRKNLFRIEYFKDESECHSGISIHSLLQLWIFQLFQRLLFCLSGSKPLFFVTWLDSMVLVAQATRRTPRYRSFRNESRIKNRRIKSDSTIHPIIPFLRSWIAFDPQRDIIMKESFSGCHVQKNFPRLTINTICHATYFHSSST